jgi:hypothetical protein
MQRTLVFSIVDVIVVRSAAYQQIELQRWKRSYIVVSTSLFFLQEMLSNHIYINPTCTNYYLRI